MSPGRSRKANYHMCGGRNLCNRKPRAEKFWAPLRGESGQQTERLAARLGRVVRGSGWRLQRISGSFQRRVFRKRAEENQVTRCTTWASGVRQGVAGTLPTGLRWRGAHCVEPLPSFLLRNTSSQSVLSSPQVRMQGKRRALRGSSTTGRWGIAIQVATKTQ